jgi:beta-glucosidase-like glycosyl hydrolase/CubicO group peptidase (beta-lactamase class C family)
VRYFVYRPSLCNFIFSHALIAYVLKRILFTGILLFAALFARCQSPVPTGVQSPITLVVPGAPPFLNANQRWVDSVFSTMTPDERIAQLIMVAAYSNRNRAHVDTISKYVQQYKIGGLVFFQGGPVRQASLYNRYQSLAKVPLWVAIDGEWGLGMRLDSTIRFPYQMTLGAVQNDTLLYRMGLEVGRQCKRIGIHINFAPVVDVNNNANNPVINFRSFGENKDNVARKSIAYMRGMQDAGIMTSAKHFPGHGDTDADSHYALPLIRHGRQRLDTLELYPFRKIIEAGVGGVMVAHLSIPSLDSTRNLPSTLSKPIVTGLLKNELGFQGLAFTDAMNMQGVTKHFPPGVADMRAILAGNDVLEYTADIPRAISEIKKAVKNGLISQEEIDARCRKVLAAKAWVGLSQYKPVDLTNLVADLNPPEAQFLNRQLAEAALTVLSNQNNLIPVRQLDTLKVAAVSVGVGSRSDFSRMLGKYTNVDPYNLSAGSSASDLGRVKAQLGKYNLVVVGIHVPSIRPGRNYGITPAMITAVRELMESGKAVAVLLGNPYTLNKFTGLESARALVLAYQDNKDTQEMAAQLIFGAVKADGKLPVTVNAFREGMGQALSSVNRLKYTMPEETGIRSEILYAKVDSLANNAVSQKATPGCVVLVAKDGKVILEKAYGYHTYENRRVVETDDIYDLASVTKISTSLAALMKLTDEGKFNVDGTLANYLPEYRRSNKADIPLRDILTHQGRLKDWIAFWKGMYKKNGKLKWHTVKADSSARYPTKVVDGLYLHRGYCRKIYKQIHHSPLNPEKKYVYSDLSYYLYPLIVERQTGKPFQTYLKDTFYGSLGASTLTFGPTRFFPKDRIVPTEYDSLFRKSLIHGTVHDEGAAMLSGLSGHAGLFGNANDVAKLMQMYLNGGSYGDVRYLNEATLREFARCQFCETGNRRGIGFDKPMIQPVANGSSARDASPESFGHSGFTGTFVWMDPQHKLLYVFLSNRVYPTRNNSKLSTMNVRTNLHQALYDAIKESQAVTAQSMR